MKHKESKQWNRKSSDILNNTKKKDFSAYRFALECSRFKGKFACLPIESYKKIIKGEVIYLGEVRCGKVYENEPYIVFKDGSDYTLLLDETTHLSMVSYEYYKAIQLPRVNKITPGGFTIDAIALRDLVLFDDEESAKLFADMSN